MTFRRQITETEVRLAFVIGGGMALVILGYLLGATQAGSADLNVARLNILEIVGLPLMVLGFVGWLVLARPWQYFDDWSTPAYTGHEDHGHDEPASVHDAATHGQEVTSAAGAEQPDNLTAIPGINARVLKVLNIAGITTFAQLAAHRPAEIERIVRDAGLRVPGGAAKWIEQAKAAGANKKVSH